MTAPEVAAQLPGIPAIRTRSQSLAMLDALLSPEGVYRYYSFDGHWTPAVELASMRNGTGDDYSIVFSPSGAWIRVFDHESAMSPWALEPPRPWPGVLDTVPAVFQEWVREPAFILDDDIPMISACLWRQATDDRWHTGQIDFPAADSLYPDGSGWLLELLLDDSPEAYREFAEEYFERSVEVNAVREIYAMRPLTQPLVSALNDELSLGDLARDVAQIGYPTA